MPSALLLLILAVVLGVLLLGVGRFGFGRHDPQLSNRLMRWRVIAQAIAIALLLGALAFSGRG